MARRAVVPEGKALFYRSKGPDQTGRAAILAGARQWLAIVLPIGVAVLAIALLLRANADLAAQVQTLQLRLDRLEVEQGQQVEGTRSLTDMVLQAIRQGAERSGVSVGLVAGDPPAATATEP